MYIKDEIDIEIDYILDLENRGVMFAPREISFFYHKNDIDITNDIQQYKGKNVLLILKSNNISYVIKNIKHVEKVEKISCIKFNVEETIFISLSAANKYLRKRKIAMFL